jgi:hypothetical protein
MMKYALGATVTIMALAVSACGARGQVHVGAGVDYGGLSHIQMAVGDVYGLPVGPLPSYLYPDELPVVYMLAREAGVSPEVVMALREQGWTWMDITYHLGVDPYLYVAHLPRQRGYWGYPGRNYRYLTDRHIIDYVNLALWASYHRRPVTQLIVIRQRVPTWTYYVHYHAPRVVFVNNKPRRHDPPSGRRGDTGRRDEPRRAEPRDATPPRGISRTTTQQPTRTIERTPTAARGGQHSSERTIERSAVPSRPTTQATNRPVTPPTRPAAQANRPVTPPTRPTAQANRPVTPPTRPAAQANRPVTPPTRPTAESNRQVTPPTRPTAQANRPVTPPTRSVAPPSRPSAGTTRPAAQPSRPAAQPSRPAAQPSRPAAQPSRPAPQASRPAASRSNNGSRGESSSSRRGSRDGD